MMQLDPDEGEKGDIGTAVIEADSSICMADSSMTETRNSNPFRRILDSSFGVKKHEDQEMKEMAGIKAPSVRTPALYNTEKQVVCHDHSYETKDELQSHYFNGSAAEVDNSNTINDCPSVFLLGKTYDLVNEVKDRKDDESSLFWFTYRCDFPSIEPYGITSDAGWGCMLRALQMLMSQSLRMHYKSRDWRPPQSLSNRRADPFFRSVLTWFADFASSNDSFYSLHNMVAAGISKYDKLPGEWYGPGTACYVLRDLAELHESRHDISMFRVHVAAGGTIYKKDIDEVMTRDKTRRSLLEQQKRARELPPPLHPLDLAWEEKLLDPGVDRLDTKWDTAMLLLIPLRLGLKSFNVEYREALVHTLSLPQSVGILGGRPRGARWFYGASSDGSKIFGLDPHTVQTAPNRRPVCTEEHNSSCPIELSDEYIRSVHTNFPETFSLPRIDPSIALGFYCRNRSEFQSVLRNLKAWNESHPKQPELFAVAESSPQYADNRCPSTVLNLVDSMSDDEQTGDEEDEYILL